MYRSAKTFSLSAAFLAEAEPVFFAVPAVLLAALPVSVFFGDDEAGPETLQNELFRKRKLLFDLSAKATEEELDRIIKIVDALVDGN